jgi:citrate synthase
VDEGHIFMESHIWLEEPEPDNPFAARAAYCHGYDVYGEMLGGAGWADMVFLLFRGEAPTRAQRAALDILAVALANPGPREPSVHAAMCGGVGGSVAAASLMAALAVGAGASGGAREVALAMEAWLVCGKDLQAWNQRLVDPDESADPLWPPLGRAAGFEPNGVTTATPVRQTLARLAELDADSHAAWLETNRVALEAAAGRPLSLPGVAAAALADLGLSPEEGEMLFLLLRLPGAAAHALEQGALGHKRFPFYRIELEENPQPGEGKAP